MAIRFAIASGNWSNTAIWDNGALPVAGDDVYANGFTVTINQNVNVGSIRSTASPAYISNIATAPMISNTQPSGIVSASSNSSGNDPWRAFDMNLGTGWTSSTANTAWISYQFPTAKTILNYAFYILVTNQAPRTWTFEGSNNGSTWTVLDTRTGVTMLLNNWYVYSVTTPGSYLYYRVNVTASGATNNFIQLGELQMTESSTYVNGNTAGGSFTLNGGVTVTLTSTSPTSAAGSPLFTYSAAAGNTSTITALNGTMFFNTQATGFITHSGTGTLTINGNLTETNIGNNNNNGIAVTSTGTLNFNGNLTSTVPYTSKQFIVITAGSTVNITGNINVLVSSSNNIGSQIISCSSAAATINIIGNINVSGNNTQATTQSTAISASAGTINMTGSITGSTVSFANQNIVNLSGSANFYLTGNITGGTNLATVVHTGTGIVSITGSVTSTGSTAALTTTGASILTVTGACTASTATNAVQATAVAATNTFTGPFISNNNYMAVLAADMLLTTTPTYMRFQSDARTMYTADYAPGYPAPGNVRSGVSYNGGLMTGTMIVPPAGSVTFGVPVDGTTGTAALTTAAVQNAVFDKLISTLTTPNSIGVRISNSLTADSLGNLLSSL